MLAVTKWKERLESIRSGTTMDVAPPFVESLRMPPIAGWEEGHAWMEWDVDPSYFHPGEALFGGYVAALADYMLAFPVWTFLGDDQGISTSNLQVSFFRPIRAGTVHVDSWLVNRSRTLVHVEAKFTQDGKLAAVATATQVIIPFVE
jgi:uncharacterized protein (TIGR00369 family)